MDPNNTHEVIFWDNLYKLRPWLSKYFLWIPYESIMLSMDISIYINISTRYIYLLENKNGHWSMKLNKEHDEPCMFSSSYGEKFDRAAEVCFYIMFKVRCHEINLLHKKGRPNKSILHCILCSNFLWRKRWRCVHVGYDSGHKTAETLLIFSIIYNEIGQMTLFSDTAAVSLLKVYGCRHIV